MPVGHSAHLLDFRRTDSGFEVDLPATNPNGDGYPYTLVIKHPQ